jgi:glycosyltransferase involved in cell wall biosynthesis
MRILHTVESYLPAIGGMQEVVRQLSERLVGLGHAVTVATRMHPDRTDKTPGGVQVVEFDLSGNAVKGIQGDAERYKQFLLDSDFDIFTNFAAQQWATDLALPLLKQIKGKKVSVPTGFSGLYDPDYSGYFEQMKTWMKDYDTNVFLSDNYRDIQFARENGITKNVLIPNGAGADEFLAPSALNIRKKLGLGPTEFLALHVGSYTGIKGQKEAVEIFLSSDIQQGTLLLVGFQNDYFKNVYERKWAYRWLRFRNRQKNKKVLITQLSRAETVAAYKEADLFLFPSRMECSPIVLFESMASQRSFPGRVGG